MLKPGRNYNAPDYRYGYNGKEKDDEVNGNSVTYDYGFRIYDARVARFLSVDPLTKSFPMLTPFQYASNNPIMNIDLDGLEGISAQPIQTTQLNDAYKANPRAYKTFVASSITVAATGGAIIEFAPAIALATDKFIGACAYTTVRIMNAAKPVVSAVTEKAIEVGVKVSNYIEKIQLSRHFLLMQQLNRLILIILMVQNYLMRKQIYS